MADVKDKHFLRGEVRDMVRVGVPALEKAVENLQARVTVLENPVDVQIEAEVAEPEAETKPKTKKAKPKTKKAK